MARFMKCISLAFIILMMLAGNAYADGLLFSEVGGAGWLQYVCLGIGILILIAILAVPNALRKAGKLPEGW